MMRKVPTVLLTLTLLAGVAGCEAIPNSGPVSSGLHDLGYAEQLVQFNPLGPVAGSSQEDIVRGFLLAASSSEDDYAVAREFLAPDYAKQWEPSLGVLVDEGGRPFSGAGDTAATVEVSSVATVDGDGELLPAQPGTKTTLRFEFTDVGGEWRIASAPAGIVLDRATFTAIWSPQHLYFFGARDTLVPETRWYQNRRSIPTEIVNGLIAGPHLGDAAWSAFPEGVDLVDDPVPVVDGVASVELSSDVMDSGEETLAAMHRQLRESMRATSGVTGVEIYVDGTMVRLPETEGDEELSTSTETTNPALVVDGVFGTYNGGGFQPLQGFGKAVAQVKPDSVTMSTDERTIAVRGRGGASLITDGDTVRVDARSSLLEPSLDRFGFVWTYADGGLMVSSITEEGTPIKAEWLKEHKPVAVRVSPDGGRIAALVPSGTSNSAILVGGILRDEDGTPQGISEESLTQMYPSGSPVDFDWIDSLRFASLTRLGAAAKVTIGGPGLIASEQGAVSGGVRIAAGGSRAQLRVLTGDGELYASQGSGWQRAIDGVSVLAKRV